MSGDIRLILSYDNDGSLQVSALEAEKVMGKAGDKSGASFSSNFNKNVGASITNTLKNIALSATALGGVTLFKSIKDASTLETINTQFETILKSSALAQKQVQDLQEFSASTPFQLVGLAEATKQLLSFGVTQEEILPNLQKLGDIASGVGADITELTIPFGRLVSTQKLTLQELDKFADRGVNIYAELAKQTGTSIKNIRDDISKGKVPFEEFGNAISNLTGPTGLFFNGMEKQSKTLAGVVSTLGDNFFNLSANLGKAFSPTITATITSISKEIGNLGKQVSNIDPYTDVLKPITQFNDAIITYVIAPLELVANTGKVVFGAINSFVATTIASFGYLGAKIGEFLQGLGVMENASQAMIDFGETSGAVAREVNADFTQTLGGIADFPLSEKLATKNEELRTFFAEQSIIADEAIVNNQEKMANVGAGVTDASITIAEGISGVWDGLRIGIDSTAKTLENTAKGTANIMKNGLAKGIAGGVQNMVNSMAKGENVAENFGKFLLGTFGDLAVQLGQFWIAQGIAIESAQAVSGTGAIVAGVALVAVGTLLKSFAGGGGGGASAPSGGAGPQPTFADSGDTVTQGFAEEGATRAEAQTIVNFNVEGNVVDQEAFFRDVAEGISEEGGRQGLVFNNLATV